MGRTARFGTVLVMGWLIVAVTSSIPWLVSGRSHLSDWTRDPPLLAIIGLHLAGATLPLVAALCLWRHRVLGAHIALALLGGAWLAWHFATYTTVAPVVRDSPRVLLSIAAVVGLSVRPLLQRSEAR